jgi:hypothetical protein
MLDTNRRILPPRPTAAASVLLCGALALSCLGSGPFDESTQLTREARNDGGGDFLGPGEGVCPEDEPKEGDPCPRQMRADNRCSYMTDECDQGGTLYTVTTEYCCFEGVWSICAVRGNCPSAPPPDADETPPMSMMPDANATPATGADARPAPPDVAPPPPDSPADAEEPTHPDAAAPAEDAAVDASAGAAPDAPADAPAPASTDAPDDAAAPDAAEGDAVDAVSAEAGEG